MNNIQISNSVPSQQCVNSFGFHIALMKRGYDGEPCDLREGIGKYYDTEISDCIEKFKDLTQVEKYLEFYYKERFDNYSAQLSNMKWKISNLFKRPFLAFGYFNELKINIERLETIKKQYSTFLADPLAHTPIQKLDENITIPKYLIGEQDYYYYPSLVRNRIVIRKLELVYRSMEKTDRLLPYSYSFNYVFSDVKNKKFNLKYSFLSLSTFDGIKWGSELGFDMLFLSEDEAKEHVSEFYKELSLLE